MGVGLLALIAAGALLCVGYVCRSEESFWPDETFTVEHWNATPSEQRYVMAKDLVRQGVLTGLVRTEVVSLLGETDSSLSDRFSYHLKSGSTNISFNGVWFIDVLFDPATGKVQTYRISGD
jgi:hypothetical protein